jgi:hypothetical protein
MGLKVKGILLEVLGIVWMEIIELIELRMMGLGWQNKDVIQVSFEMLLSIY